MRRFLPALGLAAALASPATAQYPAGPTNQSSLALTSPTPPTAANNNQVATTAYVQNVLLGGLPLANGKIYIGNVSNQATAQTLGAGVATWLATPSSANLRAAVSDETGTGSLFFQGGSIGAATGTSLNLGGGTLYGSFTNQYAAAGNPATSGTADANVSARLGISSVALDTGAFASGVIWLQARLQSNFATNFAISLNPNGGNVAIGKATAATALDVSGTVTATAFAGSLTGATGLPLTTGVTGTLPVANGGTGDTGTAWSTYTPATACTTGSGTWSTTSARFKQLGKTVFFQLDASLTAIGTCSGTQFQFTLPTTAQSAAGGAGRETNVSGAPFTCYALAASSTMVCILSGASLAVNDIMKLSGVYESP